MVVGEVVVLVCGAQNYELSHRGAAVCLRNKEMAEDNEMFDAQQ